MGATAMVNLTPTLARNRDRFTVDVQTNAKKEQRFIINASPSFELQVLDVNPKDRHLVLMVKETRPATRKHSPPVVTTHKFLCGHDERHWFVAAVPGGSVHDVVTAKEALQPREVREKASAKIAKPSKRFTRNNEVFKRQGEWFFVPTTIDKIDTLKVRFNEPMVRPGGGKPHIAEKAYRVGGTSVYVRGNETITPEEYFKLDKKKFNVQHVASDGCQSETVRLRKDLPSRSQNDRSQRMVSRPRQH